MSLVPTSTQLDAPPAVIKLLQQLHKRSLDEEEILRQPNGGYEILREARQTDATAAEQQHALVMRDKFIALDPDKACFMYSLIRSLGALNVVEAGTSFGVSTIYLALAVGQNATAAHIAPGAAKVIATEHEPSKAALAREHWDRAGDCVAPWIDLREGDLLKTLVTDLPMVDFVLFDIWTPRVLPTLKLLEPKLRSGTVILLDNTVASQAGYADFFEYIKTKPNNYKTVTLPFAGGLEMTTYWASK